MLEKNVKCEFVERLIIVFVTNVISPRIVRIVIPTRIKNKLPDVIKVTFHVRSKFCSYFAPGINRRELTFVEASNMWHVFATIET